MNSKTIIICGMHRSGTSLATQWLYRSGLSVGERLFPAGPGNVDGFFEDMDFLELHESFFKERKIPISGFVTDNIILNAAEKKQIETLVDKKRSDHSEWGWKDPRTSLFLDVYRRILPEANYFIIVRDFNSTVSSMLSRDHKFLVEKIKRKKGISRIKWALFKSMTEEEFYTKYAETYLKIWINYYENIIQHLQSLPGNRYIIACIQSLLHHDESIFSRIAQQWDFSLHYQPFEGIYKKDLISKVKDIDGYVSEISLLRKAKEIEEVISAYCTRDSLN